MILKYIVIKNMGAILFPESVSHGMVGNSFFEEISMKPESAGFAIIEEGKCTGVYGEAVSLRNLKSLPGDEHVINDSLAPTSLVKYYGYTTESIREDGLKNVPPMPSRLLLKVPDNWTEENLIQFKQTWQRMMEQPGNAVKITLVDVFDKDDLKIKERKWEPMYNKPKEED